MSEEVLDKFLDMFGEITNQFANGWDVFITNPEVTPNGAGWDFSFRMFPVEDENEAE